MSRAAKILGLLVLAGALFFLYQTKTSFTYAIFTDSITIDTDLKLKMGTLSLDDLGDPFNEAIEGTEHQTVSKEITVKNTGTLQGKASYSVSSGTGDWSDYVTISDDGHFNGQVVEPNTSINPQLTVKVKKDWTSEEPLFLTVKVRLQQANAKGNNGFYDEESFTIKISKTQKEPEEEWPADDKFKGGVYLGQQVLVGSVNGNYTTITPAKLYLSASVLGDVHKNNVQEIINKLKTNLKLESINQNLIISSFVLEEGKGLILQLKLPDNISSFSPDPGNDRLHIYNLGQYNSYRAVTNIATLITLKSDYKSNSGLKSDLSVMSRTLGTPLFFVYYGNNNRPGNIIDAKRMLIDNAIVIDNNKFSYDLDGKNNLVIKQNYSTMSNQSTTFKLVNKQSGQTVFERPIIGVNEEDISNDIAEVSWNTISTFVGQAYYAIPSKIKVNIDGNSAFGKVNLIFKFNQSALGQFFFSVGDNNRYYKVKSIVYSSDGIYMKVALDYYNDNINTNSLSEELRLYYMLYGSPVITNENKIIDHGDMYIPYIQQIAKQKMQNSVKVDQQYSEVSDSNESEDVSSKTEDQPEDNLGYAEANNLIETKDTEIVVNDNSINDTASNTESNDSSDITLPENQTDHSEKSDEGTETVQANDESATD